MLIVFDDAINRTDLIAGWLIIEPDAFGAQVRIDDVSFLYFIVIANGFIWAFRLTNVAIDTVGSDF